MRFHLDKNIIFLILCLSVSNIEGQTIGTAIEDARAYFYAGNLEKAKTKIDSILSLSELEKMAPELGDAFSLKGSISRTARDIETAIAYHTKAYYSRVEKEGKNSLPVARSSSNLGNVYLQSGNLSEAEKWFEKSFKIHKKLKTAETIKAFSPILGLAKLNTHAENFTAAAENLDLLEAIVNSNPKSASRYFLSTVAARAELEFEKGNFSLARTKIEKALSRRETLEKDPLFPTCLLQSANYEIAAGELIKAEKTLLDALQISDVFGSNFDHFRGLCFQSLGAIQFRLGNWNRAQVYFENADGFFKDSDFEKIEVLTEIARIYRIENKLEEARTVLSHAAGLLPEEGRGHYKFFKTRRRLNLEFGNTFSESGIFEPAADFYQRALEDTEKGNLADAEKSACLFKIADCFLTQNQPQKAKSELKKAKRLLKNQRGGQQYAYLILLGRAASIEGKFNEALTYFEKAIAAVSDSENASAFLFEWIQGQFFKTKTLAAIARVQNSDWESVLESAEKAALAIEKLGGNFNDPESEIDLRARFSEVFDLAIEACFELKKTDGKYLERGLLIAEQFKKSRLEQLAFQTGFFESALPESVLLRRTELRKKLEDARKNRFLFSGSEDVSIPSFAPEELDKMIVNLQTAFNRLEDSIRLILPKYSEFSAEAKEADLASFQKSLRPDQTLLHFQRTDEVIYVFIVNFENVFFEKIENTDELEKLIADYYQLCSIAPQGVKFENRKSEAERIVEISESLYSQIILPFQENLKDNLLIVPDGLLAYLPFESLIFESDNDKENFPGHRYLVEKRSVQYLHSFSDFLNSKKKTEPRSSKSFLAFAPDFTDNHFGLEPLKNNESEAKSLADFLGGKTRLGKDATETIFQELAGEFNVLHLSTHSVVNDQNPAYSFVAFTEISDSTENELMFVREIYSKKINADLVVLSSCQSASGQLLRGEGLMSIARAFFRAGARSLVASLWNVSDVEAPIIMTDFYKNLDEGTDKPNALRQAKINYIKSGFAENRNEIGAHPYFWAGFVPMNDDSPISFPRSYFWWKIILVLALVGFCGRIVFQLFKIYIPKPEK